MQQAQRSGSIRRINPKVHKMMAKLNGWQRLWVVATLIFGFVIAGAVVENWPSGPRTGGVMMPCGPIHLSVLNQDRAKAKKSALDYDQCLVENAKNRHQEELREQQARDELREKRAMRILGAVVFWVLGSGLAYVLGWLIAWVRQGFRQTDGAK